MNKNTVYKLFNALLSLTAFGIIGYLAFQYPAKLLSFGRLTAVPGFLLLLVCFTPLGSLSFGDPNERLSQRQWWGGLLKAHVVLLVFTVTVAMAFISKGPEYITPIDFDQALAQIEQYTFTQWGIFPWGIFAIWGAMIAYLAYVKKLPPYLYAMVDKLWPKRLGSLVKTFIEATQFGATALAISAVAVAIILLFTYLIELFVGGSHLSVVPLTCTILGVFVIFFSLNSTQIKIRRWHHQLSLAHLVGICIVCLIGLLVISAVANEWFAKHYLSFVQQSVCRQCGDYFSSSPQSERLSALYWGWWLVWAPLGGSYLAKLAKGRTLREFVLSLYLFPVVIVLFLLGLGQWFQASPPQAATLWVSVAILASLPFLSWWFLNRMLCGVYDSGFLVSGFFPVAPKPIADRLQVTRPSKVVGLSKFSRQFVMIIYSTLFFHLTAGWYGLQIQLLAMGVVVVDAIYAGTLFWIAQWVVARKRGTNRSL